MYKLDDISLMHVNFVYGGCAIPFLGQQPVVNIIDRFLIKKKANEKSCSEIAFSFKDNSETIS